MKTENKTLLENYRTSCKGEKPVEEKEVALFIFSSTFGKNLEERLMLIIISAKTTT